MNLPKRDDDFHLSRTIKASAENKFDAHARSIHVRTDRMFAVLMVLQWVGGIVMALVVSPQTWIGAQSSTHPHVMMAVIGGGVMASLPITLALFRPGRVSTRMVISASQVLFSCLLIHLSGGRIETHFHVFGSLAFLAAYRDWRVLAPATIIVAIDHLVRGIWWPQSVFGVATSSNWRWLEHAAWVVFEDIFLLITIRQSVGEMKDLAQHTAHLEIAVKAAEESEKRAELANQSKSQFLANMSHEIRTPLNGIIGFTEIMLREGHRFSDEEQRRHPTMIHSSRGMTISEVDRRDYLNSIRTCGRHLLGLINDILDLSKIEAGQMDVQRIRCSPQEVISEVISVMRVQAQEKGLDLDCVWQSDVPKTIETDPAKLRQLLMNLLGNAIKFTKRGNVQIEARLEQSNETPRLVIDIIDTGIGIPAEKLQEIFKPFVQVDNSVVRRFGGSGLGLGISRWIAHALGGNLTVESTMGSGTTFTASVAIGALSDIDMLAPPLSDAFSSQPTDSSYDKLGMPAAKVLLIEDGAINRKLIVAVLSEAGLAVATAENGQIGVELALNEHFDLILMDMQMPVMDGYTATRRLREAGITIPIIALTAHAMKGDEEKCLATGCSGYLTKPIDIGALLNALAAALQKQRPEAEGMASALDEDVREIRPRDVEPLVSTLPTDKAVFREIVEEFVQFLEQQLKALWAAVDNGDAEELARVAHSLKGAAGSAGFAAFTDPTQRLERMGKERRLDNTKTILAELVDLSGRIVPLKQEVMKG